MYANRHIFSPPSTQEIPNGTSSDSSGSSYHTAPTGLSRTESYMSISTMNSDISDAMSITGTPIADRETQDVNHEQQEEYPLPRVETDKILEQLLRVIEHRDSAFQQRDHDDYDQLLAQIQLVDAAIGGRELEMLREQVMWMMNTKAYG